MGRVRRAALITAVLAATLAGGAPASALPPGRSGLYGGGGVGEYLQFVSLRVAPGGGFGARATLVTECSPRFGDALTESVAVRDAQLSERGRYRATTSFSDDLEPGVPTVGGLYAEGTVAFSARVLAGGAARGTVRVRTTYTDPRSGAELARCDTGPIAWRARRPPPDAGAGRTRLQPGTHRGTTAQEAPFLMRVTREGRLVRRAGMTVRMGCPSGIGLPLDVVAHRVRVRRGRFGAAGGFERPYTYPDGTQVVETYSWELRGRFGSRGAAGTFAMRGVVRQAGGGEQLGSCRSGRIAWRALR